MNWQKLDARASACSFRLRFGPTLDRHYAARSLLLQPRIVVYLKKTVEHTLCKQPTNLVSTC